MRRLSLVLTVLGLLATRSLAETAELPVVADTNLSSYPSEQGLNYGGSSRLRVKGIEMFALFRCDLSAIRDWRVASAVLRLRPARDDHRLRWLGLHTVAQAWEEGTGAGEGTPDGATFLSPAADGRAWGEGPDFLAVSFTHGGSRVSYAEVRRLADGWLEVDVPAWLVDQMRAGASDGFLLTDESGQTHANNDIYSREQANARPVLLVTGEAAPVAPPEPVRELRLVPAPGLATAATGGAAAEWTAEADAIAFDVFIDGVALPRWRAPRLVEGRWRLDLPGLRPDAAVQVEVRAVNGTGQASEAAPAQGRSSAARPQAAALAPRPGAAAPAPSATPGLVLGVFDELAKVHPVTGRVLEDDPAAYDRPGTLLPAAAGIGLEAGRNEFVGAMLAVGIARGSASGVRVEASALTGPGGATIPAPALSRMWYVRDGAWMAEVCLPVGGPFAIPDSANGIEGQTNQSILVEVYVPHATPPGDYAGAVSIRTVEGDEGTVPVLVRVGEAELPDAIEFAVDLNSYGDVAGQYDLDPASEGYLAIERAYHRLAHAHRANWDPLPYSQSGNMTPGTAPPLSGAGAERRVSDWAAWDRRYGPLLDGSAFADQPRAGVPIHAMYLPFHEAWPSTMNHYRYTPSTADYPACIVEHAMLAPPIEEAFDPAFALEFRAVARQFREHVAERGWGTTWLQVYLNNKYYYKDPAQGGRGASWWLLDEPLARDDWLALRWFLDLAKDDAGALPPPFVARGDISRPQWEPDWMDGTFGLYTIGGEIYRYPRICRDLVERNRARVWTYGACNEVARPDVETVVWAWQAFLAGADGVVPWNTIAGDGNYEQPEATAILYPGRRYGLGEPLPSLRLKALRRGAQDAEYFRMLCERRGLWREELARLLHGALPGTALPESASAEDVRPLRLGRLSPAELGRVRDQVRASVAE